MGVSRSFVIKVSLMQKYLLLILEKHYFGDDDPVTSRFGTRRRSMACDDDPVQTENGDQNDCFGLQDQAQNMN